MDVRVFEDDFPPKNRVDQTLVALEIRIVDGAGVHVFDPDAVVREHGALPLDQPVGQSMLSGKPAYRYQEDDVVMLLSRDEISRLVTQTLAPKEYFQLRGEFGIFYQINEDYYDLETGLPWPKWRALS